MERTTRREGMKAGRREALQIDGKLSGELLLHVQVVAAAFNKGGQYGKVNTRRTLENSPKFIQSEWPKTWKKRESVSARHGIF